MHRRALRHRQPERDAGRDVRVLVRIEDMADLPEIHDLRDVRQNAREDVRSARIEKHDLVARRDDVLVRLDRRLLLLFLPSEEQEFVPSLIVQNCRVDMFHRVQPLRSRNRLPIGKDVCHSRPAPSGRPRPAVRGGREGSPVSGRSLPSGESPAARAFPPLRRGPKCRESGRAG